MFYSATMSDTIENAEDTLMNKNKCKIQSLSTWSLQFNGIMKKEMSIRLEIFCFLSIVILLCDLKQNTISL